MASIVTKWWRWYRRWKKKLDDILNNGALTNAYLLGFFNKTPRNKDEFKEQKTEIQVFLGVFSQIIRESTRNGVLLALNDAFGK